MQSWKKPIKWLGMEKLLTRNLTALAEAYCDASGLSESTVGRLCAADGRFFSRIHEGKTYTLRKYDDVLGWFSKHWPDGVDWPEGVDRPTRHTTEAAE